MGIFLSYRRVDSEVAVGTIYDRLVARFSSSRVFRDLNSLPLGQPFPQALDEALASAEVALVVIGPAWLSATDPAGRRRLDDPADFVRLEVEKALATGIPVVPLLVNRASLPSANDLPESLRPLVLRHGVHIRPDPDFHSDMVRLIDGLDALLGVNVELVDGAEAEPRPLEPAATGFGPHWVWVSALGLCLTVGGVAVWLTGLGRATPTAQAIADPTEGTPDAAGERGKVVATVPTQPTPDTNDTPPKRPTARTEVDEIQVRISQKASEMGEVAVRTLVPNAQPGRTVVQSTRVSPDGKSVEVVIKIEYESFMKGQTLLRFTVEAEKLTGLNFDRADDPRAPPLASDDRLRAVEEKFQGVWHTGK